MKRNCFTNQVAAGLVLGLLLAFTIPSLCLAQEQQSNRIERWEVFGGLWLMNGDSAKSTDLGVSVEFDDTRLYGLGFGYNITEHLNLNSELLFGNTDYDGTSLGNPVSDNTDLIAWNVNMDYNFWKKSLTPFVTGGIGIMGFDGKIGNFDFNEDNLSYNVGIGVRWDFDNLFFKASYRWLWTDLEDADDDMNFDGFHFAGGLML